MATYQQWSQSYFDNLTPDQHNANNRWFQSIRDKLTDSGILYVPVLDKEFNKLGEEVNNEEEQSYIDSLLTSG
tara:strand:- start:357 stop:575 length:219 start_codon:yes stop_codon:yes gene_type:complete